ncbi:MAG: hypothetical protein NC409_13440 [Clostridium sp.]|nr:hypothetical protein [Clostridium sp.]
MNPEEEKTIPVQAADAELHQNTPDPASDQTGTPVSAEPGMDQSNAQGYPQNPNAQFNGAQSYQQNPNAQFGGAQGYPQTGMNQNNAYYNGAQSFTQGFQNMNGGAGMNNGYGGGTNQTNAQWNNAQGYQQNPNAQFNGAQGYQQNPNAQFNSAQNYQQNPNAQFNSAQNYQQNPNAQFGGAQGYQQTPNSQFGGAQGYPQNTNAQFDGAQGYPQNTNAQFGAGMNQAQYGNPQGYQNPYYVNPASVPNAAPAKKKSRKKIWIPIVSVVLVAAIAVGIYFLVSKKTRNPEEIVTAAMSNAFSADRTSSVTGWLQSQDLNTLASDSAYQYDVDVTFTEISGSLADEISMLEGLGISTTMQLDRDAERLMSGASILYDGTTYLEYEVYAYDDYLAVACPSLFDGYIEFKTSNFGADFNNSPLAAALDTQLDSSFAFRLFDLLDTAYETETEIPQEVQDFIDAVRYEEGDKKDLQVNGKTQTCQGYNIVITRESMEQLARWFCDYADSLGTPISYDEFAAALPNKDLVMNVYVDNKGRMARFAFDFPLDNAQTELSCQIDFTGLNDRPADHIAGELKLTVEGYSYGFRFESTTTASDSSETQNTTMSIDVSGISIANADYTSTFDSGSQTGHMDLSVSAMYTSLLSMNLDYSYSDVVPGEHFTLNMDDLTLDIAGELTIGLTGSSTVSKLNGSVSTPSGTKYDLFTITEDDILSLGEEILDNVSNGPLSFLLVDLYSSYYLPDTTNDMGGIPSADW